MSGTPGVRARAEDPCRSGHCPCPPPSSHLPSCPLRTDLQGDTVVWELLLYKNLHDEVSSLGQLRGGVKKSGGPRRCKESRSEDSSGCLMSTSPPHRSLLPTLTPNIAQVLQREKTPGMAELCTELPKAVKLCLRRQVWSQTVWVPTLPLATVQP